MMDIKAQTVLLLAAALVLPLFVQADDEIDVKGGFFDSGSVNRDFFGGSSRRSSATQKSKTKADTEIKSTADSFRIGASTAAPIEKTKAAGDANTQSGSFGVTEGGDTRFRGNNRRAVEQAADAIKKLRALQSGDSPLDKTILESGEFYKKTIVSQPVPGSQPTPKPTPMLNESITAQTKTPGALGAKMLPKEEGAPVKLTLVVSAFPESHLRKQLALLRRVHVEQKVPIGDVIVAGGYKMFMVDQRKVAQDYAKVAERAARSRQSYPRSSGDIEKMISRGDVDSLAVAANVEFSPRIMRQAFDVSDEQAVEVLKSASKSELRKAKWTTLSRKSLQFAAAINNMSSEERKRLTEIAAKKYADPENLPSFAPDPYANLARLGLYPSRMANMPPFLRSLKVQTSPVWLISIGNTTHIFEGEYDPRQLFSVDGKFIGPRS